MNPNRQSQPKVSRMPSPSQSEPPASDSRSLPELFEAEETPLLRYAFSLIGRRAVAEEVVQDVFLQLHRHWDEVEKPVAWLYRSVRNKAYNHNRDHKREVFAEDNEQHESDDKDG